jgi:hypothetical protein
MLYFKVSKFIGLESKFKEMNMCSGFGVDFERQIALLDGRCTVGRGSERNNNTI